MNQKNDSVVFMRATPLPFLAPALLGALLAVGVPLVTLLPLSTVDWNLISPLEWGHGDNFTRVLGDAQFISSLATTLVIAFVATALQIFLGGVMGYYLSSWTRSMKVLAAVFLLPWMAAPVAIAVAWKWILAPTGGLLSESLGFRQDLLTNPATAPLVVAGVIAWAGIGYTALFVASGLRSIPRHTLDAARLDGAGPARLFWEIQLPQMRRIAFFLVVTVTLASLNVYDVVYVLTGGGPSGATAMATFTITQTALTTFQVGESAAMAIIFTLVELAVIAVEYLIYRLLTRRFV
ncbi:multiple sugar transport system permease protein [Aurantimicrobium minutum]|uniref:carbohydrate ABC transporter permease n=1 Tax=Aurantimicrobium minutum TaxID=708131 RepID=UPI002473FF9D|nr:sugar ABC transporter permease [Aurantimicrobium minutum]MDH6532585.1 multiple sugar transport system permease protein [Aurantimicrobium minutum]